MSSPYFWKTGCFAYIFKINLRSNLNLISRQASCRWLEKRLIFLKLILRNVKEWKPLECKKTYGRTLYDIEINDIEINFVVGPLSFYDVEQQLVLISSQSRRLMRTEWNGLPFPLLLWNPLKFFSRHITIHSKQLQCQDVPPPCPPLIILSSAPISHLLPGDKWTVAWATGSTQELWRPSVSPESLWGTLKQKKYYVEPAPQSAKYPLNKLYLSYDCTTWTKYSLRFLRHVRAGILSLGPQFPVSQCVAVKQESRFHFKSGTIMHMHACML